MFKSIFLQALSSLRDHPSRTFLTLLGVIVGIAAVITVIAAGSGGKAIIMEEFRGMGPDTLIIQANWMELSLKRELKPEKLTAEDLEDLKKYAEKSKHFTPIIDMRAIIQVGKKQQELSVTGTTNEYINYVDIGLAEGRLISTEEVEKKKKVAILGADIAHELFPTASPLGKYIRISGEPVLIIGILLHKEKTYGVSLSDPDETYNKAIVVPVTIFDRIFNTRIRGYDMVFCKAKNLSDIAAAKKQILEVLSRRHGFWPGGAAKFMVTDMKSQLEMINNVTSTITTAVAILAGISLFVAAIGIMNVMLVSVKERTREIGIRKAVGAKRRHIMMQFLIEAILVCGGGGLIGIGAAFLAAKIIAKSAGWPVIIDNNVVALAFFLSLATGLISGLYPANKAARLIPQEALRYE
ncbi:ABC transporter permease [Spirochaetia bacterium 38H-sp]|uniref:ABC transporter permease n=1 Tax=Rarispira pelagica TaxID=3141764 RepID=A0ABU9UC94_9SPIR